MEAEEIAIAFVRNFICKHGTPNVIKTDQGSNIQSNLMKYFAKMFKIKQMRAAAFHPQTMGSIERLHHSLVEYLKMFSTKQDWDFLLCLAMLSYNTSIHEGLGYTPFELIYGKKARINLRLEYTI